ncbi:MAG: hypothetical protein GY749_19610 [Desulfobacteraceae bacterium]|nr:hypothetical protein [Desulfobacteraceae bacterium]
MNKEYQSDLPASGTVNNKTFMGIRLFFLVCLFIVISVSSVYVQVRNHEFVNYDDGLYVADNHHVKNGLTLEGLIWSFSFSNKKNTYWHPLTWIFHMLNYQLFKSDAGLHHWANLILHTINSLLLFLVFRRMTGKLWESAFVAALFALHPINAESVAWVAGLKNLLSTFFWLMTMSAYVYYCEKPACYRYLLTFTVFASGLLAKPMLVTLPFTLLLLDYWPLDRLKKQNFKKVVAEKIPFIVLSLACLYLSSTSLSDYGGMSVKNVPMKLRMENALVSYVSYIGKMIWPDNLAFFYPYPDSIPIWKTSGAGLMLICLSVLILWILRKIPALGIGWLWYLGTLVPVIGIVQGGDWPAMADRWAYIPLIGIFIIIAWGIPELLTFWQHRKTGITVAAGLFFPVLTALTFLQAGYWKNSISLCEHALKATGSENYVARVNLGVALNREGRPVEACEHYSALLRKFPDDVETHNNMGTALIVQGRLDKAIDHYSEAVNKAPGFAKAHKNLRNALNLRTVINASVLKMHESLNSGDPEIMDIRNREMDDIIALYKNQMATMPGFNKKYFDINNYSKVSIVKKKYADAQKKINNDNVLNENPNSEIEY